jgi:hypothetical protein
MHSANVSSGQMSTYVMSRNCHGKIILIVVTSILVLIPVFRQGSLGMLQRTILLGCAALFVSGLACADVDDVFNASGTFADGTTLGGTVTIDVTNGTTIASSITEGGIAFSQVYSNGFYGTGVTAVLLSGAEDALEFDYGTTSLIGYTGGALASITNPFDTVETLSDISQLVSGTLTLQAPPPPPAMSAPEMNPTSAVSEFALMFGGLAVLRGRKRGGSAKE